MMDLSWCRYYLAFRWKSVSKHLNWVFCYRKPFIWFVRSHLFKLSALSYFITQCFWERWSCHKSGCTIFWKLVVCYQRKESKKGLLKFCGISIMLECTSLHYIHKSGETIMQLAGKYIAENYPKIGFWEHLRRQTGHTVTGSWFIFDQLYLVTVWSPWRKLWRWEYKKCLGTIHSSNNSCRVGKSSPEDIVPVIWT